jgi:S1 RNA binding domain protein
MSLEVGSIVEGKVTGITNFGAFVELSEGVTGLVHISEVADAYVHDIKDYLKENDTVKVKIINMRDGKIGLSIRQVNQGSQDGDIRGRARGGARRQAGRNKSFEEKLRGFMRESDERLASLRRSLDSKRGGRGTRRDF